ncbi:hypothetical protein J31TS4_22050 [Paenibacillus sp. J31TS4]|nr:hypothetical protein J31TS4_22050 [Paenibacillus sp. J31TS4]
MPRWRFSCPSAKQLRKEAEALPGMPGRPRPLACQAGAGLDGPAPAKSGETDKPMLGTGWHE